MTELNFNANDVEPATGRFELLPIDDFLAGCCVMKLKLAGEKICKDPLISPNTRNHTVIMVLFALICSELL